MTDESSPFDFFPRPRTWPTWMLTASRNSGVAPPELRQIPVRISVNWVESPNGGAIGVPDPLWDYGNPGHWTEPFLSKPTESASGGILGNMGAELEGPPWFDPGPDMKSIMPWPVWMRAVAPESLFTGQRAPSPKPPIPTGLPMSRAGDPYTAPVSESEPLRTPPRDNLVAGRAAVPSQPSGLNVAVPQVHDLGSARYPGTAPSPAGTEPIPGNDDLLSPTILARSWEFGACNRRHRAGILEVAERYGLGRPCAAYSCAAAFRERSSGKANRSDRASCCAGAIWATPEPISHKLLPSAALTVQAPSKASQTSPNSTNACDLELSPQLQ